VVLVVWSLNQEEVDVMTTVTVLGHIQRNEAVVITLAEDLDADGRVLVTRPGNLLFFGVWA